MSRRTSSWSRTVSAVPGRTRTQGASQVADTRQSWRTLRTRGRAMKPRSLGQALRRSTTRRKRVRASIRRKPEERADPDLDLDVDQQSGSRCRPLRRYRHTRRVRGSRRAGSSGVARRLHWRSRRSTSGSVRAARCVAGTSLGRCRSRRTGSTTLRSRVLRTTPQAWGRSLSARGRNRMEGTDITAILAPPEHHTPCAQNPGENGNGRARIAAQVARPITPSTS